MEIKVDSGTIFLVRITLTFIFLVLFVFVLHVGYVIFIPLAFAFLVAMFLYPLMQFFKRLHFGQQTSAFLSILLFTLFIGAILYFFSRQVIHFVKELPEGANNFTAIIQEVQHWAASHRIPINNHESVDKVSETINKVADAIVNSAGTTFLHAIKVFVLFIIFLLFTFFILVYHNLLKEFILSFFNEWQKPKVNEVLLNIRFMTHNYLIGVLTEVASVFILIFLLLLVFGIKYSLLIALMAAVLNVIPYIGIYTTAAISMLTTLVYSTETKAIDVGLIFLMVHVIDANILVPYIIGQKVKINPFIAFIALIAGELIWGIAGMILFIPLTAILRIVLQNIKELKPWAMLIGAKNSNLKM